MTADLTTRIRSALRAAGDPDQAAGQQAYMKSAMPFWGVSAPQLRTALRPVLAAYAPAGPAQWRRDVKTVWDGATHREERYAALALARHRVATDWQDLAALELYRHLVVTGAWWDLVDEIAAHLVGAVLARHRPQTTAILREWMVGGDDLWLRRTAILAQLRHRGDTDTALLHAAVAANLDDTSFWIRKAIGWALREHARTDPGWVRAEVARLDALGPGLSPLSRREALKHLGPDSSPPPRLAR